MIIVTYEYPSANNNPVRQTYKCVTKEQAEHVCKMVEARKEHGYKLIDVTTDVFEN